MTAQRLKRENVMLAYPAEPHKVLQRLGPSFLVQPKLNGERCRVEWFCDEPYLLSSYGNIFSHIPAVNAAIKDLDQNRHLPYDGELYVHGWPREKIHSVASRTVNPHPEAASLQFHIFDVQDETAPQFERLATLLNLFQENTSALLHLVPTYASTPEKWTEDLQSFIDHGYEGIILRHVTAPYTPKRTHGLLKYKPTEEDTYEILGVMEAVSREGFPKGMVGAFLVCGDDGTTFEVGAGKLRHNRRTVLWQHRHKLPGKQLIVKHEKLRTINSIPIAAVAVEVLDVALNNLE